MKNTLNISFIVFILYKPKQLEPSGCYGACERWSANKIKELEKENVVVWGREVLIKVVACAVLHTLWLASNLERSFLRE